MTYYNTTNKRPDALDKARRRANGQRDRVLAFFEKMAGSMFAPHEVHRMIMPDAPITSVRRTMTDLTEEGKLVKTDEMVEGPYGDPVHLWRLNCGVRDQEQLNLF